MKPSVRKELPDGAELSERHSNAAKCCAGRGPQKWLVTVLFKRINLQKIRIWQQGKERSHSSALE